MLYIKPPETASGVISNGTSLSISLPGTPKTKLRPRFARRKGRVNTFDPQSEDKETVRWQLKARLGAWEPFSGPVTLSMICIFGVPKSRKRKGEVFHMVKPDLDNLVKWIGDVGNGILWEDDRQIVSISAVKIYGVDPRTVITVSKVNE